MICKHGTCLSNIFFKDGESPSEAVNGAQNSSGFPLGLLKEKDLDSDLDIDFSDLYLARHSTQSGSKYFVYLTR